MHTHVQNFSRAQRTLRRVSLPPGPLPGPPFLSPTTHSSDVAPEKGLPSYTSLLALRCTPASSSPGFAGRFYLRQSVPTPSCLTGPAISRCLSFGVCSRAPVFLTDWRLEAHFARRCGRGVPEGPAPPVPPRLLLWERVQLLQPLPRPLWVDREKTGKCPQVQARAPVRGGLLRSPRESVPTLHRHVTLDPSRPSSTRRLLT